MNKQIEEDYRRALSLLDYEREHGRFRWKMREEPLNTGDRIFNTRYGGRVAGSVSREKYPQRILCAYFGTTSKIGLHTGRLVWFAHTGKIPPRRLYFLDGDSLNTKYTNLSLVTPYKDRNKLPPYLWVTANSARFMAVYRSKSIGVFDDPTTAYGAVLDFVRNRTNSPLTLTDESVLWPND